MGGKGLVKLSISETFGIILNFEDSDFSFYVKAVNKELLDESPGF